MDHWSYRRCFVVGYLLLGPAFVHHSADVVRHPRIVRWPRYSILAALQVSTARPAIFEHYGRRL